MIFCFGYFCDKLIRRDLYILLRILFFLLLSFNNNSSGNSSSIIFFELSIFFFSGDLSVLTCCFLSFSVIFFHFIINNFAFSLTSLLLDFNNSFKTKPILELYLNKKIYIYVFTFKSGVFTCRSFICFKIFRILS